MTEALFVTCLATSCREAPREDQPPTSGSAAGLERRATLAQLERDPASLIEASHAKASESASLGDGRRLVAIDLFNRSAFVLRDIQGEVTWLDERGSPLGATPFAVVGALPPGASDRFTEETGTLSSEPFSGEAPQFRVTLRRATVTDPKPATQGF